MTAVEACFLLGFSGELLWADRSASASRLPDSVERWRAIWAHRVDLALIAHSHPHGPLTFSEEDRTTMSAIDDALGRALRYAVVTADGVIYREPNGQVVVAVEGPPWVSALRAASGLG